MGGRSFIVVLAVLAIVALLGFGLIADGGDEIAIGEPAPDGPLERLDGDGEARLADYRGEWVLVNFWASWCDPCRTESPAIERYAQRHRDELTVVGINTEDLSEDALAFVDEYELTWEMLRDNEGKRKDDYAIFALPETFLLDPEGRIALIRRGAVDRDYLEEHVTPLINGEAPQA